jgi:hypothetical protein
MGTELSPTFSSTEHGSEHCGFFKTEDFKERLWSHTRRNISKHDVDLDF